MVNVDTQMLAVVSSSFNDMADRWDFDYWDVISRRETD